MHIVEKILNNTTPYGKIRASHEGSLHSSTLSFRLIDFVGNSRRSSSLNIRKHINAVRTTLRD